MTEEELSNKLKAGDFPMTPEHGAALIVKELLSDLPWESQQVVRRVIENWADDWGSACAAVVADGYKYDQTA